MTLEMRKALERLKSCGRMVRVRDGRTDWLPEDEAPVWDTNGSKHEWNWRLQNKSRTQTASIGRLVDAGWAEYENGKKAVRYIDRDEPLKKAVEMIHRLKAEVEHPTDDTKICFQLADDARCLLQELEAQKGLEDA